MAASAQRTALVVASKQATKAAVTAPFAYSVMVSNEMESENQPAAMYTSPIDVEPEITPSATSSKIFIQTSFEVLTNSGARGFWTIYKDSTQLGDTNGMASIDSSTDGGSVSMTFLDSPSSTSQLTYAVYMKSNGTNCSRNQ